MEQRANVRTLKRNRRGQKTRKLLQRVGRELIQSRGFDAVSVEDIAEAAKLSRGTFYIHYSGKIELLSDILSDDLGRQIEAYESLAKIPHINVHTVRAWLNDFRAAFDERRGSMSLFKHLAALDPHRNEVIEAHRDQAIAILAKRFEAFRMAGLPPLEARERRARAFLLLFQIEGVTALFAEQGKSPDLAIGFDILSARILAFLERRD